MKREQKRKVGRPANPKRIGLPAVGTFTPANTEKFWARVNKNGSIPIAHPELGACWEWTGGGNGEGYGQVRINYRQIGTHQAAWELTHGAIPDGLRVLHKCGNRACCNPDHLYLSTANADMLGSKRANWSTGTTRHHVTNAQVATIRLQAANGRTLADLAREYDVSFNTISNIVKERTRKIKK